MSEKQITGKDIVKRIAPVAIAFVLIVLIAVIVVSVKSCSNKTPKVKNADEVYLTLGDMEITNDRLYTYLKQNYGTAELIRLVDEKIYADELVEVRKTKSEDLDHLTDLDKFIMDSVFEKELTSTDASSVKEANKEKWVELCDSLRMNNLIKTVSEEDYDPYNLNTSVWGVVREYYALQFVRNSQAKVAYKNKLEKERTEADKEGLFDEDKIKEYYEDNYSDTVVGFYIPFTSESAALKTMNAVGINTNSTLLGKNGWIRGSFDYNSTAGIPDDAYLSATEVLDKFIEMYNLVYGYLGNQITSEDYTAVYDDEKTLSFAKAAIKEAMVEVEEVEGNVVLPLEVLVNGSSDKVEITWEVTDGTNLTLAEDGKTLTYVKPENNGTVTVKVTATFKYKEVTESTVTYSIDVKSVDETKEAKTVSVEAVDQFETYKFDTDKLAEKDIKAEWTTAELTAINSTLAGILKADSTTYYVSDDASNFYKSYTIKPQSCGDYYVLAIKVLIKVNPDYNDETVKQEIVDKLLEEAITDNVIEQMIYEKRNEVGLQILDRYIEAIYDYQYTTFFESTLKLTDYTKYTDSKKKDDVNVAKFNVNGKEVTITAEELFAELKDKYAVSTTVDLINQYRVISNNEFNTIYNFYTNDVKDEDTFKALLKSEVGGFRKNFELDYFTYSYLSYYGFTPNFPAKYGWNNFKKDYFGAYSDEELLVNAQFGGSVYSKALEALTNSLYTTAGEGTWEETDLYKAMKKAYDEWYGLNVVNLFIYVDNNYDNNIDTQSDKKVTNEETGEYEFETTEWTSEQKALVDELMNLVFEHAADTAQNGIYNQLNEIVTVYKNAGFEEPTSLPTDTDTIYTYNYWAKFKKAGLMLKVESAQAYNNSSSLVEEFLDELESMYKTLTEQNLEGTLEVPYVSPNNVETTYGYHKIIALSITAPTELPTEEDILIYELLDKAADNADSEISYKKEAYDAAVKELKEKYDIEYTSEYAMDDEAQARIKAWYDNAISEISGNNVLTAGLIEYLESAKANIQTADKAEFIRLLDIIIEVSRKDLEEE